ncbi:MAG: KaiC domain-containing protein, partial [Desulfurococcales archaeon]|nr:KaiC domain-containing protein [Desulfurococcales archaeon]
MARGSGGVLVERLRTGVPGFDPLVAGGIPRGFMVAVVGEPGTGKTVFSIHFAWQGVLEGDRVIYVTTEESRESVLKQAAMFGMDLAGAVDRGRAIVIDALMRGRGDEWSLQDLTVDALVEKVIEAKRRLGYGGARLIIDSMSAFWLDKPAMARKYSYTVKRLLYRWDFTTLAVSQYAITTSEAFGWGIEHVADGIVRFRRRIRGGVLRRYVLVEKMRQT